MKKLRRIVLVTGAPACSGLAYYHYLAIRDRSRYPVEIVDNGQASYGRTLPQRLAARAQRALGVARSQFSRVLPAVGKQPDEAAIVLYNLACVTPDEIRRLSELGVALYAYFPDSPFGIPASSWADIRRVLPLFTGVFTFLNDLVPVFYQYGARRVRRVPFAYCRYTHLRTDVHRAPDGHLYYFGTYGPTVERWLMPLAHFNLIIHGHGWSRASSPELRKASMHSAAIDSQMGKAAEGQLVVNFIRAEHGSGHSMKTFELPAAGACVITNRSEEQLEFFPEGSGVCYFNTVEEMTGLVARCMEDPSRIVAAIGKRDAYLVGHSYHERVETLLDEIEGGFDDRTPAFDGSDGQCAGRPCACRLSR